MFKRNSVFTIISFHSFFIVVRILTKLLYKQKTVVPDVNQQKTVVPDAISTKKVVPDAISTKMVVPDALSTKTVV